MNPLVYKERPCRHEFNLKSGDVFCKSYVIWSEGFSISDLPDHAVIESLIHSGLSNWENKNDHAAAFAITHFGADGCYFLISRWNDANMLRHRVFGVQTDNDEWRISPLDDRSIVACVWELKLMMQERDYWLEEVLMAPESLSEAERIQNYLKRTYEGGL